ncbi:hypothetical protein BKA70DRAFT_1228075 [Coprinopsis sp. MPI-PUGE-AT-0042]|nr:hypothetical protein BKA70DRAFT_1228075 [Coprinopsis sp. MPI-PUGE-AT-0042]
MNPVSMQTCDELTVCTEMDGKWFVSVVIDCSWHPDGALLVAAIGDHELRKSIELLIESHEETIGEYKYLNSTYRNNWEVVSFEHASPNDDMRLEALRKTLDDGINTTRLALLQNRFGMFRRKDLFLSWVPSSGDLKHLCIHRLNGALLGMTWYKVFDPRAQPPFKPQPCIRCDVRLSAPDSISLNKSQIGTGQQADQRLIPFTYILAMTTGIQADPVPNLSSATYQSEDDDPRTSYESEPELEYGSSSDDGSATFHGPQKAAPHLAHEELRLRVKTLSIRAHLRISALIDMLRDTGSVISGSGALTVLVPCRFVNAGLDIFCAFNKHRDVFEFLQHNGYGTPRKGKLYPCRARDRLAEDPDFHSSFVAPSAIHTFYQLRHNDNGYVVSVVRSHSSCSIAPILGYHSTIMMNWISWDGVSCMYPALTFDYKGLTTALSFNYVISDRVPQPPALLPQPAQALSHSEWQGCVQGFHNPYCKRAEREINDWGTLLMAFTARTEVAAYPVNVSWKLAMRFLGQEAGDMLGFGQNADRAWIRVQGERQYSQYSVLKDPNVQEASTDVDLNEFS